MASTVISAFNEFLKNSINLDPNQTVTARSSKDWLIGQINNLPASYSSFPELVSWFHLHYGSFARRTKTRPLDDIDIMIGLHAHEATHNFYTTTHATITVTKNVPNLRNLCDAGTTTLNSIKVVNCFVSHLQKIHQYKNATIKRNQEAAVLSLNSYDWNFDIVPCFRSTDDLTGKNYYLIPDGKGNWKKTDPRIDRDKATSINQRHDGNVLNVVRTIKYWNTRRKVSVPSYLLENLVLNYYANSTAKASVFVDIEIPYVLTYIANVIYSPVQDPKGIQGDINQLTYEQKKQISDMALAHAKAANTAREHEKSERHHMSILYWKDVFGDEFPDYS